MKLIDESPIGAWLWLALIVQAVAEVWFIDWWLHAHGHEYLTTEFREALANPLWGIVLAGATGAVVAVGLYHFFWQTN